MNICLDITKKFNSVINYNYFFDSAPMNPVIFLDYTNSSVSHYEFDLMNFGLNVSDEMEQVFLKNRSFFENIVKCSYEYKSLLIYGKAKITINGVKGVDLQYSSKDEKLYYSLPYQVKKGDFDFECGGFSSCSNHFVIAHIIANSSAQATITFSSDDYFLMSSNSMEFENIAASKQTPFQYECNNVFDRFIKRFSQSPGKMFDINFINRYYKTYFENGFNTSVAIKDEKF